MKKIQVLFQNITAKRETILEQLLRLEKQKSLYLKAFNAKEQSLIRAGNLSYLNSPEQELARLTFILHEKKRQQDRALRIKQIQYQEFNLKQSLIGLAQEKKGLEKLTQKQRVKQQKRAVRHSELLLNQWILFKGTRHD